MAYPSKKEILNVVCISFYDLKLSYLKTSHAHQSLGRPFSWSRVLEELRVPIHDGAEGRQLVGVAQCFPTMAMSLLSNLL